MNSHNDIQNILNYIEEHLNEELSIELLANKALLSKFYFQRIFYKLVGVTVMEYVKLRRLAKASNEIIEGRKITDIAFNLGFNSLEAFIRSFKSVYKMTPTEYRKLKTPLAHFYKPDLSLKYRVANLGVPIIASGIVLEVNLKELTEEMKLVGINKECTMTNAGKDTPALAWESYFKEKHNINNRSDSGAECGISYPSDKVNSFNYLAASEVSEFDNDNNFSTFIVPKGLYAVCTFSAKDFYSLTNNALDKAFNYFLQTYLPNSDYKMISNYAIEYYDYRCLKDHPLPKQIQNAPEEIIKNPPEMDLMVMVVKK